MFNSSISKISLLNKFETYVQDYRHFECNELANTHDDYFSDIRPSIDFITIFIASGIDIQYFLSSLTYRRSYSNVTVFEIVINSRVYIVLIRKVITVVDNYFCGYSVHLSHPTKDLILHIHSLLTQHNIAYNISRIEYSLDIYTPYYKELFHDCKISALLKNQCKKNLVRKKYETTYYLANPRKDRTKAGRVYIKNIRGINVLRMELLLKNKYISRIYSSGKDLVSMSSLRAEEVFRIFQFKHVKTGTIFVRLCKKYALPKRNILLILYFRILHDIYNEGLYTIYNNIGPYV